MTFQMYCFTKEQNNLVREMIIYHGEAKEQKTLVIYGSTEVLLQSAHKSPINNRRSELIDCWGGEIDWGHF